MASDGLNVRSKVLEEFGLMVTLERLDEKTSLFVVRFESSTGAFPSLETVNSIVFETPTSTSPKFNAVGSTVKSLVASTLRFTGIWERSFSGSLLVRSMVVS